MVSLEMEKEMVQRTWKLEIILNYTIVQFFMDKTAKVSCANFCGQNCKPSYLIFCGENCKPFLQFLFAKNWKNLLLYTIIKVPHKPRDILNYNCLFYCLLLQWWFSFNGWAWACWFFFRHYIFAMSYISFLYDISIISLNLQLMSLAI